MLSKLQNLQLRVVKPDNPYRPTSFKYHIFKACLAKGEFNKEEFREMVLSLKQELGVQSKMQDERLWKAWFAEFFTKEKAFAVVE
jgi:hypothetical protein